MPRLSDSQSSACQRMQRGFTLIELMIVIALLGIFAAIAVPNFTQFINKSRTQSFNNELLSLLQYARSTAVEQRTFFRVCKEDSAWTVKKACTDTDVMRRLDIPSTITATTTTTPISFRYNGSGTEATLVTCQGSDFANGFTVEVKVSGSIQSWPRGMKNSTTSMTACQ